MTDRELMQQALNALENFCEYGAIQRPIEIRDALRARLAQPEPEPEPEPYCWTWDKWISGGYWEAQYGWEPYRGEKRPQHVTDAKPLYTDPPQQRSEQWWKHEVSNAFANGYEKGRAKREWQGLTDAERRDCQERTTIFAGEGIDAFARAIEAKLKEKNETYK